MDYTSLLAYFFGGAFLVNAIPHTVSGVQGRAFQSPFASPPGKGLSSAIVNVCWGFFNIAAAYWLIYRVGKFDVRSNEHVLAVAAGWLFCGALLAWWFGWQHGGSNPSDAAKRQ